MDLKEAKNVPSYRTAKKRVGRGTGSGKGKTCGKGHKGAKCRSGWGGRLYAEGGQMPLFRRLPKKGFNNKFKKEYTIINVRDFNSFESGKTVTPWVLLSEGIVSKIAKDGVKVLGKGRINVGLEIVAQKFSKKAVNKITKAGGKAVVSGKSESLNV